MFAAAVEDVNGTSSPAWRVMADGWKHHDPADFNNLMPATSQLSSDFFTAVPSTLSDVSAFSYDAVAALGFAACSGKRFRLSVVWLSARIACELCS